VRVAVISDIHANIEAFQAVLCDLEHRADQVLNLGDLVGYNASPNECVELARKTEMHSIQGNHDLAICNPKLAEKFNIYAYKAILWTKKTLTEENTRFLCSLAESFMTSCGLVCHGSPEGILHYIELHFQARAILKKMKKRFWGETNVCLFGHTHKSKIWRMDVRGDGDPRSSYFIFDTESKTVSFRLVEYDCATTMKKIIAAGLPELFADRLIHGT